MIFRYFDRLRAASAASRQRHAFVAASLVTAAAAALWVATLPDTILQGTALVTSTSTPAARPFSSLWQQAREQWAAAFATVSTSTTERTAAVQAVATSGVRQIVLSPEDVALARASSSIDYRPKRETSPGPVAPVVRIATTTTTSTPPAP